MQTFAHIFIRQLKLGVLVALLCNCSDGFARDSEWSELINKGTQEEAEQHYAASIKYFDRAAALAEKTGTGLQNVRSLNHLIVALIENNQLDAADTSLKKAIDRVTAAKLAHSKELGEMLVCMSDVGNVYKMQMQSAKNSQVEAKALHKYVECMTIVQPNVDSETSNALTAMASKFMWEGRYEQAAEVLKEHASALKKGKPLDKERLYTLLAEYASAEAASNHFEVAERLYAERHALYKTFHKPAEIQVDEANYERQLGIVAYLRGDYALATKHYEKALATYLRYTPTWKAMIALNLYSLGATALANKDVEGASKHFENCLKIASSERGDSLAACAAMSCDRLAAIFSKQGKSNEVKALLLKAKKIRSENPLWKTNHNPDPEKFFLIWGFLPSGA